jgi:hypothetical protein
MPRMRECDPLNQTGAGSSGSSGQNSKKRRYVVARNLRASRPFPVYANETLTSSFRCDGVRFRRGGRTGSPYAGNSTGSNSASSPHTHK